MFELKNSKIIQILVVLIASILLMQNITPNGSATSPDSLSYMDLAMNIKNGNGFVASDYALDKSPSPAFNEKRSWPILYPALLSTAMRYFADVLTISMISTLLLFMAVSLGFLIVSTKERWSYAFFSSLSLMVSVPIITVYSYAWSETLFIPVLMFSVWATIQYFDLKPDMVVRRLLLLSALLGALIALSYTRYIGTVFSFLLVLVYFANNGGKLGRGAVLLAGLIYTLVVGHLFWSNYLVTGFFSGTLRHPSDKSVIDNIVDIWDVILCIIPSSQLELTMALAISLLAVFGMKKLSNSTDIVQDKVACRKALILSLVAMTYLISIVASRSISQFDMLDVRLLTPLFVVFMLFLSVIPACFSVHSKKGLFFSVMALFFTISFSIRGVEQLVVSVDNWKKYDTPGHRLNHDFTYNNFTVSPEAQSQRVQFFSSLVGETGVVVADSPSMWRFVTGLKSFQKPKEISREVILYLNSLPPRSLLIFSGLEWESFLTEFQSVIETPKYIEIGEYIGVKLPLKFVNQ